jgi:hypothetical protein
VPTTSGPSLGWREGRGPLCSRFRAPHWPRVIQRPALHAVGGPAPARPSHSPLTGRPHEPQMTGCHSLLSCLSKRNATMNDHDPTSPDQTVPARPVSIATSVPTPSSPDSSAAVTMATQPRRPRRRRVPLRQLKASSSLGRPAEPPSRPRRSSCSRLAAADLRLPRRQG